MLEKELKRLIELSSLEHALEVVKREVAILEKAEFENMKEDEMRLEANEIRQEEEARLNGYDSWEAYVEGETE